MHKVSHTTISDLRTPYLLLAHFLALNIHQEQSVLTCTALTSLTCLFPSLSTLPFLSSYLDYLYPQDPCLHLVHPSRSLPLCNLNHHFLCQPTPLLFHLTNFGCMRWSLGAQDVPGVGKFRIDECCISIKWLPPFSLIHVSSSFSQSFFPFQQFICIASHCGSIAPVHWPRKMLEHLCCCYLIFLSSTVNVFENPQRWCSLHSTQ